jgi:hypothetical protein
MLHRYVTPTAAWCVIAQCCVLTAGCAPSLRPEDVPGDWSARDHKSGATLSQIRFAPDGSFSGQVPGDMMGAATPASIGARGSWSLVREEGGQRVRLRFDPSALAPLGYGNELFVLGGDTGGLRLTYYRGDPDSGDAVDFRRSR